MTRTDNESGKPIVVSSPYVAHALLQGVRAEFPKEGLVYARAGSFYQWIQCSELPYLVIEAWSTGSALDRYWFTNEEILEPGFAFIGPCVVASQPKKPFCG